MPDLLRTPRLTGEWGGARPWLEEHGVELNLGLTTIYQGNVRGGVQTRHAHRVSGSYDLELKLQTEPLKLWKGGTFYAYAEGGWDNGVSQYVGDRFGLNFDAIGCHPIRLDELWYEQELFDRHLRVRFGKLDLRVDFDTNAFANDETAQFLNSGLRNTGNLPFPDPGHGIQLVVTPFDWVYFAAGLADAEADVNTSGFETAYHGPARFFSIYEFGLTPTWKTGWGELPGNYRVGLWHNPGSLPKFYDDHDGGVHEAPMKSDDVGFYANLDQLLFREHPERDVDEQGLGVFARYGFAHGDVNEVEHFWSVGGQYRGLVPARDEDVLAFGVAQGLLSRQLRLEDRNPERETALELYYNARVLPWLHVTPDFQWILNPGGEGGRDAFVIGLRLQMSF